MSPYVINLVEILCIYALISGCACVTVHLTETPEIITRYKEQLTPILITSGLYDIVILSAPKVNTEALYYLHKPNGDAIELKFEHNKTEEKHIKHNDVLVKNASRQTKTVIFNKNKYRIFNVNTRGIDHDTTDVFANEKSKMAAYDYMIGPLQDGDHGNWVLSVYYKDDKGLWIELYQVITIEIIEIVPLRPEKSMLRPGDTFALGIAYPIQDLQGCQIIPPKSTIDRFYDRDKFKLDSCVFVMKNVTIQDQGVWKIIAVGNIVYEGKAFLRVQRDVIK